MCYQSLIAVGSVYSHVIVNGGLPNVETDKLEKSCATPMQITALQNVF